MTLVRFNNSPKRVAFPEFFNEVMENIINENADAASFSNPACNVIENKEGFKIEFALPGYNKKMVAINVDNHVLTVSGKKADKKNDSEDVNFTRREFNYGEFERSFTLPDTIDQENIKATFSDGILSVEIPKKPELQPKSLKININ